MKGIKGCVVVILGGGGEGAYVVKLGILLFGNPDFFVWFSMVAQ